MTENDRKWLRPEVVDQNIYQRMLAIMQDLKYIQKEDKTVNGQYRFVGHDAVTRKCHEMFVKHGVYCNPTVVEWDQQGNRTHVTMTLTFVNVDHPEDCIITQAFGFGVDNQDKGPGKAVSYAYKYGLLKALALETGDDAEKDNIDFKADLEMAIERHADTIEAVKIAISEDNLSGAAEAWYELTEDEMKSIWVAPTKGGPFTTEERRIMKSPEFRKAHYGEANE